MIQNEKIFFSGFGQLFEPIKGLSATPRAKQNELIPARVVDIILDRNHPKYQSDANLGMVRYRDITTDELNTYNDKAIERWAIPMTRYIKQYPLIGETIMISSGPSPWSFLMPNFDFKYYTSPVSFFGTNHYNPLPIQVPAEGNQSASLEFPKPGAYFSPKEHAGLLPYEGDVIFEGRFGNSIRMSSTQLGSDNKTWSSQGSDNDSIVIINASTPRSQSFVESPNRDSSVWICKNQKIPLVIAPILDKKLLLTSWGGGLQAGSEIPSDFITDTERVKIVAEGGDSST